MPAKPPAPSIVAAERLRRVGQKIREHRKSIRVSATAAAEAAGMSRVTLHRIEKGEPSVTMGAYMNALSALGLDVDIVTPTNAAVLAEQTTGGKGWLPARVCLDDYPQLKQVAWQVHGTDYLTPSEAFGIYERNRRHLDFARMAQRERDLIDSLRVAFTEGRAVE
ncbi:helix-turn-helix domain-containing protein [Aromatoleum buckelii]|uniref:Helix-turn-helix domain-containing protein n=1 Tax=Aromatoleum buckelii TaxID=200254 RepID=A0ABX1N6K3_9RHOO|nr:helix-turn-helix transcriptional regulator [Aromatoleum buckelii]MCK0509780.1 helix-turn-helix domain-containing protein [Aromatoleum buckelii]MCK0512738.1 helix-turn-helix domain-containing protein [Aromatoleum buckelii]